MQPNLSNSKISRVLAKALKNRRVIKADDSALIFYDLSFIEKKISEIKKSFPQNSLHTIAVKANPLTKILKQIRETGAGLEAASLPELYLAQRAGFAPEKIVFDSPAKNISELKFAMSLGVLINADNFSELERIAGLRRTIKSKSTFGIRINPQVGTGKISSTSVAGVYSKFGIPLNENKLQLQEKFLKYDWLTGVHLHIGSQACSPEMLIDGIGKVMRFVKETNELLQKRKSRKINVIDIGGGLPVHYLPAERVISVKVFAENLRKKYKELFTPEFKIITEFGRYVHANAGWTASRIEYLKKSKGISTAAIHVGADLFLRESYRPKDWHHEIFSADKYGKVKKSRKKRRYNIAGPLCFADDFLSKEIPLPVLQESDWIIIKDTGAYALSMWSRYNSRQIPKVIGYFEDGEKFITLKEREKLEHLWNFWS